MADRLVQTAAPLPSGQASAPVLTQERPSVSIAAALTVDPSTTNPGTFTFTSTAVFSLAFGNAPFKIKVENEIGLATVASGTTLTVIRGQDGTTNAAHGIGKTVAALADVQYVVPIRSASVSFTGAVATFRTLGAAATSQNLFSIENAAGSAVIIGVRELSAEMVYTTALVTRPVEFKTSRPTALPTGGTALSKEKQDTTQASSASVVLRGATASDGGAATAITATAGAMLWHQYGTVAWTLVGQYIATPDMFLLPADMSSSDYVVLRANEALLVQVNAAATTDNPATHMYTVRCAWDEYTVP